MTEPAKLPSGPGSLDSVRRAIEAAASVAPSSRDDDIEDFGTDGPLANDCPVTPLGMIGMIVFYLDENRQLIALPARDHSRLNIMKLFGRQVGYLYKYWPRLKEDSNKDFIVTGWKPEAAAEALMCAAATKGIWNPTQRERGLGARRGDDGELVIHCGDKIIVFPAGKHSYRNRTECAPGVIGNYVYPAAEKQPEPWPEPVPRGAKDPALELMTLLNTWNWKRGDIDAILILGWIGAAIIAGALKWRPAVWVTGGFGTGKSTFQELLQLLLPGLLDGANVTAASIWQTLKNSTLPVALDEAEASNDNRRLLALVELARAAASGTKFRRGGNDHNATQFTAQSAFLFSSILMPPMPPQDKSRMAILQLQKLSGDGKGPKLTAKKWRTVGQQLQRRMIEGWERFDDTLDFFRASLSQVGHSQRGQDQFGVLLTCADILLNEIAPSSDCAAAAWVLKLKAADIAETEDQGQDEDSMLQHLLTSSVDPFRNGTRHLVAHWVRMAAGYTESSPLEIDKAQEALGQYGLKIERYQNSEWLAIATNHNGLAALFNDTHWAAKSGAPGVWTQAALRLPGATRPRGKASADGTPGRPKTVYFAGAYSKATIIPMAIVMPTTPGEPTRPPKNVRLGDDDDL